MKILMIIPSLSSGGAERVLSGLANHWVDKDNCTIEIVVLMQGQDFYDINEKIKIHRLNYSSDGLLKIFNLFKMLLKLRAVIRSVAPDICFSFIRQSNVLTLLAAKGINTKVVISERDSPNAYVSKMYSVLRNKLYPSCDGMIVQTQEYRKFILSKMSDINLKVIPNPVRNIPEKLGKKKNIIICAGRLIPVKGHDYLLEAFSKCQNKKDWKLVILGEGILRNHLLSKAKDLGIAHQVELPGAVKNIDEWLSNASIFAFSSLSEGFPNALAEGMSASLPCVSFDCITGPRDLINHNYSGYLVDVGDIATFSMHLDKLIEDSILRNYIGCNAKKVANSLNFKAISEMYFNFLMQVYQSVDNENI